MIMISPEDADGYEEHSVNSTHLQADHSPSCYVPRITVKIAEELSQTQIRFLRSDL
jgi:hypothetical protein